MVKELTSLLNKKEFLYSCILLGAIILFSSLLFKDIFSQRTLIPNLEPYPDTLYYIVPARNLVMGNGFVMSRDFAEIARNVPPLYSIFLVPFYFINPSVQMFYFANVFLSIAALLLFFLILKKITQNIWIISLSLFLYATNYYLYWYPQWAMAENLLLTIYLALLLLLLLKVSYKNVLLAVVLSVAMYFTKYSAAPISLTYLGFYLFKFIKEVDVKSHIKKIPKGNKYFLLVFVFVAIVVLVFGKEIVRVVGVGISAFTGIFDSGNNWLSLSYFPNNIRIYMRALIGGNERLLWDYTYVMHPILAISGLIGLVFGFFNKKTFFLSITIIGTTLVGVMFLSVFYTTDIRYIYQAIPALLIGVSILLKQIDVKLGNKRHVYMFGIVLLLFTIYLAGNAIRIKDQVVLNLKYAETPWNYISVLQLNEYFSEKVDNKPIVISPMTPYYTDFYSNDNYDLLPLSTEQEFRKYKTEVWGDYDYSDLMVLYEDMIDDGKEVYLSTYGLGNESYLHNAFEEIKDRFTLTEVYSGCYDLCKIYKVDKNIYLD